MKLHWQWALVLGVLGLPYLLVLPLGWLWLYTQGWFWYWLIGMVVFTFAGWPILRWMQRKTTNVTRVEVMPSPYWPDAGKRAWHDIETIAERERDIDIDINHPEPLWSVLQEILETVARHFHPQSDQPMLEVPVPHLLRIVENVARDLRDATLDRLPGSHILTINDMTRLGRLANVTQQLYGFYRLIAFGLNPASALLRELKRVAAGQLITASAQEVKRWMIVFCIKRAGYYAIQLYSGHLEYDLETFRAHQTLRSHRDLHTAEHITSEPLRILLVGQVNAGKSSLVHALFGETRAAVDVVPLTPGAMPYHVADHTHIPDALVLDTSGYASATQPEDWVQQSPEHILLGGKLGGM